MSIQIGNMNIEEIDAALQAGQTLQQIADGAGLPYGTLYTAIRGAGYRLEKYGKLVPIHAPALDGEREENAA